MFSEFPKSTEAPRVIHIASLGCEMKVRFCYARVTYIGSYRAGIPSTAAYFERDRTYMSGIP